jgi:glutathione S-transferase
MAAEGDGHKLTLYHICPCRSARVVTLIEELHDLGVDVPVEVKPIEWCQVYLDSPEYRKMNPFGTIPAMSDGKDLHMNESNACLLYILKRFGGDKLQPAADDVAGWAAYYNWMFRSETCLAEPLSRWMMHSDASPLPPEMRQAAIADAALQQALKGYQVLEEALEGKEFLAGDAFTAADVATGYSAGFLVAMKFTQDGKFPNVQAYNDRINGRPAAHRVWKDFEPPAM